MLMFPTVPRRATTFMSFHTCIYPSRYTSGRSDYSAVERITSQRRTSVFSSGGCRRFGAFQQGLDRDPGCTRSGRANLRPRGYRFSFDGKCGTQGSFDNRGVSGSLCVVSSGCNGGVDPGGGSVRSVHEE